MSERNTIRAPWRLSHFLVAAPFCVRADLLDESKESDEGDNRFEAEQRTPPGASH